jgi:putative photosynthetic complex assembly protein
MSVAPVKHSASVNQVHPGNQERLDMPQASRGERISRWAPAMVIAAVVALAVAIIIGEWRSGSLGVQRVVDVHSVVFDPQVDGTLAVSLTASNGKVSRTVLPSSLEGFVATLAKSLVRDRRRYDAAETLPYRLTRFENGTMMLKDPVIGTVIRLDAFGPSNLAAFKALIPADITSKGIKP